MTEAARSPAAPLGTDDTAPVGPAPAGVVVGWSCAAAGGLLLLLWLQQRVLPSLFAPPAVPFFDRLVPWSEFGVFAVVHLAAALSLLAAGWAVLGGRRFAPALFVLGGWGGTAFAFAALWPGDAIFFRLKTAALAAHVPGADAVGRGEFWRLISGGRLFCGGLLVVAWLALLVVGTIHLLRDRDDYWR